MHAGSDIHPPADGPIDRGRAALLPLASGFLMGAADIVPGVSGGTIALLLGIYERLLANVRRGAAALSQLIRGSVAGFVDDLRAIEWRWLILLLSGIGAAVALLASALEAGLEDHPVELSALFLGLVVGSIVIAAGDVRERTPPNVGAAVLAAIATFALLGLRPAAVTDPSPLVFLGAGSIAICAMILPGVSGSFLLLTMGMYEPLLDAGTARDWLPVAAFGVGAVAGLSLFSSGLSWVLNRAHDLVLSVLVGLMIGSLRVLWPWPAGVDGVGDVRIHAPVIDEVAGAAGLAVLGLVAVLGIARVARART